jgi:hypothetical protein
MAPSMMSDIAFLASGLQRDNIKFVYIYESGILRKAVRSAIVMHAETHGLLPVDASGATFESLLHQSSLFAPPFPILDLGEASRGTKKRDESETIRKLQRDSVATTRQLRYDGRAPNSTISAELKQQVRQSIAESEAKQASRKFDADNCARLMVNDDANGFLLLVPRRHPITRASHWRRALGACLVIEEAAPNSETALEIFEFHVRRRGLQALAAQSAPSAFDAFLQWTSEERRSLPRALAELDLILFAPQWYGRASETKLRGRRRATDLLNIRLFDFLKFRDARTLIAFLKSCDAMMNKRMFTNVQAVKELYEKTEAIVSGSDRRYARANADIGLNQVVWALRLLSSESSLLANSFMTAVEALSQQFIAASSLSTWIQDPITWRADFGIRREYSDNPAVLRARQRLAGTLLSRVSARCVALPVVLDEEFASLVSSSDPELSQTRDV